MRGPRGDLDGSRRRHVLSFCGGAKYENPVSDRDLSAPHSADATMTDRMDGTEHDSRYRVAVRRGPRISLYPHRKSPDPNDTNSVRDWLETRPRPWAIDLFCGAGGLSLGLEGGGFSVVAAADSDPVAIETHAANIQGLTWTGDLSDPTEFLRNLDNWGIEDVDLLAGGPPCQPFSTAGMSKIGDLVRRGNRCPRDERADLWRSFFANKYEILYQQSMTGRRRIGDRERARERPLPERAYRVEGEVRDRRG